MFHVDHTQEISSSSRMYKSERFPLVICTGNFPSLFIAENYTIIFNKQNKQRCTLQNTDTTTFNNTCKTSRVITTVTD
jgi:hypothetical protein